MSRRYVLMHPHVDEWRHLKYCVAVDLSKAFDSVSHSLLLSKLRAYGFFDSALWRKQRVKIRNSYSDSIKHGVPQGSILGPLLFNLFINDLTYFVVDANLRLYADDTTQYLSNSYSSLTYKAHVKSVCDKVNAKVAAFRRVRKFIPADVMIIIYKAFILPHLEYCAPVLVGLSSGTTTTTTTMITSTYHNSSYHNKLGHLCLQYLPSNNHFQCEEIPGVSPRKT